MRAQFIRGEDPKEEIGIGNKVVQIGNKMERAARIICRDYNLDLSTIKKEVNERGISVEFEGLKPNFVHPYKYWIWYDAEREHFFAGYSTISTDQIEDQKPVETLEQAMLETRIYLNKYNWTAKGAKYESVNFERGMEPKDSMKIGDVTGRKIKLAYKQIKEAINKMAVEWWGNEEILTQTYNSYMRIKEKKTPNYIEIGIENRVGGSTYFYYLVYSPDPDPDLTEWAAGYKINHKSKHGYSPNVKTEEQDEIPYDNLEDAINKMEWWYKNL